MSGVKLIGANLSYSNLVGTCLSNQDLSGANLAYANLSGDDMRGANLNSTDLSHANLQRVILAGANLTNANLQLVRSGQVTAEGVTFPSGWISINGYIVGPGADLNSASLYGEDLSGLNLTGAKLNYAELSGANLANTALTGASMNFANLVDADLTNANLHAAHLDYADMDHAILTGADMPDSFQFGANSTGVTYGAAQPVIATLSAAISSVPRKTNMSHAVLSSANLRGSSFDGVNLTGATFQNSNLENVSFKNANLASVSFLGAAWSHTLCNDGKLSEAHTPKACLALSLILPTIQTPLTVPKQLKRNHKFTVALKTKQGVPITVSVSGKCSLVKNFKKVGKKQVLASFSVRAKPSKGLCTVSIKAKSATGYRALSQVSRIAVT